MTQKSSAAVRPTDKDAIMARLLGQVAKFKARLEKLGAENAALHARVCELEEKLSQPPKTPDNSSTPPCQGHKASNETASKAKQEAPPGARRMLILSMGINVPPPQSQKRQSKNQPERAPAHWPGSAPVGV